jgi:membrane protein
MSVKGLGRLLKAALQAYIDDNVPRLGAALSFYTVFALSPLFLIVLFFASMLFDSSSVREAMLGEIGNLIGSQGARAMESLLAASLPHHQGVLASALATVTLVLTATGLFVELQSDLNTIWKVEAKPGLGLWDFIRTRLLSFAMVVGVGFLLLVSLLVSAILAAVGKFVGSLAPEFANAWAWVNGLGSFLVITLLFATVFKALPDVRISWRAVWIGSMTTAALFTAGKSLIGLYLGRSSTVSAYGAAGSLVVVLLWVYYSAQIVFFGAELTKAYVQSKGEQLAPKTTGQPAPKLVEVPRKPGLPGVQS